MFYYKGDLMEKLPMTMTSLWITTETLQRISVLASKRKWSRNKWITTTLDRESKPRI